MLVSEIARKIAKAEGHCSHSRIDDITGILTKFADLTYESKEPVNALVKVGINRHLHFKKAKKNELQPRS